MKRLLTLLFTITCVQLYAQDFDNPGQYMDYISTQQENITKKYLSYNSAASHGKKAKKVEKLRQKLLSEIEEARMNIASMGKYKGDGEYKDSAVSFLKFYYNVINDDYDKIINMEDIAEQSYDEMEAYIMLQEEISRKLAEANARMSAAQKKFAGKYNINLIESKDEISQMMKTVSKVNKYYDKLYLIFFKPYIQESNLNKAITAANVNAIEQNKNALAKYAQEALSKIDTLTAFPGDGALRNACKQLLNFYYKEATEKMKAISDHFLAQERFEAIKKEMDKKSDRTKEDVERFNKSIDEFNKSINTFNQTNKSLYDQRSELLENWNKAVKDFLDDQMPKYK